MRLVIDTNVLLSALLLSAGRFAWLRHAWQSDRVMPLVSRETTGELLRVLAYPKFKLSADAQEYLLADCLPWTEIVALPKRRPKVPRCRDPDDVKFLELALTGRADYLVTGDADLQVLAADFAIAIVSPRQLRELIPAKQHD